MNNKKELNKRTLSFGLNTAFITIVVIALIGVANFLVAKYPHKFDLTKNKIHTFSDQTDKVMAGIKDELTATLYGDFGSREKYRGVIDNYKKLSGNFKFELVDPNKEPTRAKTAGIKKMDTLVLGYHGKTAKVEDLTEEKITNEIIKLSKDTQFIVCTVTGHGEPSFTNTEAGGFMAAKKALEDQSYAVKEINLQQMAKVPDECTSLVMMGVSKALFPAEIAMLTTYLDNGGRLVVAVEAVITQSDQTQEIRTLLKNWGIDVKGGLIIDPFSRKQGVDASVPIIGLFNKESPIAKEFTQGAVMPFCRPVDLTNPAPEGLKTTWLAKSSAAAWSEMNLASITKGEVQYNEGIDIKGPLTTAVVVSGKKKDSKAARETRIVAFGSSQFADNNYVRFGENLDLFMNAVSWTLEDESMISIRAKDDEGSKVELSQTQGILIFWISVVAVPLIISILGIVIWVRRKKL